MIRCQTPLLMKASMKSLHILVTMPCALLSLSAIAAGNHAGGHDDAAIGQPGDASKVTRTIKVDMTDAMRFKAQGETIRFVVKNSGKLKHEMVLGTQKELKEHAEAMKKNPEMEHADANMVTLAPGKTGEIVWQFTKAGKVDFACLQPGHYDAGMKGLVTVAAGKTVAVRQDVTIRTGETPSSSSVASVSTPVTAQSAVKAQGPSAAGDLTEAEVRKVDKDNKKITLKHAEIKNLEMPPMTMVFQVNDAALLEKFKAGDKVRFKASKQGGNIVATDIEPAR